MPGCIDTSTFDPQTLIVEVQGLLVVFGRWALIFLFESSWKNMENDTTFVRMRSGDHLGDVKRPRKGISVAPSNLTFLLPVIAIDRKGFRRMKEGQIYKILPQMF